MGFLPVKKWQQAVFTFNLHIRMRAAVAFPSKGLTQKQKERDTNKLAEILHHLS